jgi:hypothetical protein
MSAPVICFGQQPCGFFPKRYLYAKVRTARSLHSEIGGEIVFFYHDSDHDPRETKTILHRRATSAPEPLNFMFENKLQRKFSPLYAKRIPADWQQKTTLKLPNFVDIPLLALFREASGATVADFCLDMYRRMGLLDGIRVVRSSSPDVRRAACDIADYFVDVVHEGELVRARYSDGTLRLHEGGDVYIDLPPSTFAREQISPSRDTRLRWMQSVVHCTHYVTGVSEQAYLHTEDARDIQFVTRDDIDRPEEAYVDLSEPRSH